jgi:hypothetical protein
MMSRGDLSAGVIFLAAMVLCGAITPVLINKVKPKPKPILPLVPALSVVETNEDGVPTHLNINGQMWNVRKVPFLFITIAETRCKERTIVYIDDPSPMALRTNLIHEVFHAGGCLHGGDTWWNSIHPDNFDHPGIYHLADFMTSFSHDNPEFMEWLTEW